jgi:hypothetical protein
MTGDPEVGSGNSLTSEWPTNMELAGLVSTCAFERSRFASDVSILLEANS